MSANPTIARTRPLRGPEKVAALLLVMGKPLASRLLGHFEPADLKIITQSAADLGAVSINTLEEIVEEFAGRFQVGVELRATVDDAESLISGILPPDQVRDIMSDVTGVSNTSTWEQIGALGNDVLSAYMLQQHPQVIALILSRLPSGKAAALLELFPRATRNAITRRLLVLGPVADASFRVVENRLRQDLIVNPPASANAGTVRMADIINKMDPDQADDVLKSLDTDRPDQAVALRAKLFAFDDLISLPITTRQALFEKIPSDRIVLAISTAGVDFRANVLSSLTARARRLAENELATIGTPPARDVLAARRLITDTVLAMAERGEIELQRTA